MKILIIGGGISDEREVSLRSARSILEGAKAAGYDAQLYDWDGSEEWIKNHANEFDAILPILHGKGGEDGTIQELLESTGMPYLGSVPGIAQLCFDKELARKKVSTMGYFVPKGAVLNYRQYLDSDLVIKPHVVKPVMGGSSIHTHIIKDLTQADPSIESSFEFYGTMLVEELIDGAEITSATLDGKKLPLVEIIPPEGQQFDYENKYNGATQELCPPLHVDAELQDQAIEMASKIHKNMGCRHLSRTDIMIRDGKLYFLEINTIPGLTNQSLFPKAAAAVGLGFPELVDYFIQLVLK